MAHLQLALRLWQALAMMQQQQAAQRLAVAQLQLRVRQHEELVRHEHEEEQELTLQTDVRSDVGQTSQFADVNTQPPTPTQHADTSGDE